MHPNKTPQDTIDRVVLFLNDGLTHRDIAKLTGVSTCMVSHIRRDYGIAIQKGKRMSDEQYRADVGDKGRFEELKGALLYMSAAKVVPGEDIWELLNDSWLRGRVQRCPEGAIWKNIKWSIIAYRRERNGTRNQADHKIKCATKYMDLDDEEKTQIAFEAGEAGFRTKAETGRFFDCWCRGMSRTYALVIKLRFIEDMELEEIARTVGVTASTVAKTLNRALRDIKTKMQAAA